MTNETRKHPDYSASAVNLVNPPELKRVLEERQSFTSLIANLKVVMEAYPEWADLNKAEQRLADHDRYIKGLIDQLGSYQDVEVGEYAVKQLKRTKLYSATNFESCFPQYAEAVLTKSINVPVLEGLIKGNLLDEDGLRRAHIIEDKETFAYIIK